MIEKKAFQPYREEDEREKDTGKVFTIRLNAAELENLKIIKQHIQQEKDSTAIKQMVVYAFLVLQDRSNLHLLELLNDNLRRNKRLGIEKVE
jgi:hypothetical protein